VTPSTNEALVRRLLAVISGDAPLTEATRLLAPDVVCHMDRFATRGTDVWLDWLAFLRRKAGGAVRADVERVVAHPDGTLTAFGWLHVTGAHAAARAPQQNAATYRIADGRIAEVWTTRENYVTIFGARARHPLRWLLVLVELMIWRRLPSGRRMHALHEHGGAG